jgi:hypothetical protein
MSNQELAEKTRKALEEFQRLPPEEQVERLTASSTIDEHGRVLMGVDILGGLANWSDRNLRWLIDCLARRNDNAVQPRYTVIQRKASTLRDERASTGQIVADKYAATGRFILTGVEGHEFGRCNRIADCDELAARMGLGIVRSLDASGYFGHAMIRKVQGELDS